MQQKVRRSVYHLSCKRLFNIYYSSSSDNIFAVFILCGFEHCVANMYYFSVAGMWSGKTLLYLLVMTLGNAVGGVVFPVIRRVITAEAK